MDDETAHNHNQKESAIFKRTNSTENRFIMNQAKLEINSTQYLPGIHDPGPLTWPENMDNNAVESMETGVNRYAKAEAQLDELIEEMKLYRPDIEMVEPQPNQQRKMPKKKTIKQLFTVASKFQRNLRRGVYLACVLYHEDRILVTNEDFVPVIEIDETFPSSVHNDLHWLMKVSCTWNDTKLIRLEMEKNVSSSIHFRSKILSAVIQMQSSLGVQNLGQIYYKALKDARGTMVISTVNYIKYPKSISLLNSKWVSTNKVFKKIVLSDDLNLSELLMASVQQQIIYHQVSSLKLSRGLYLAYLKMESSVEAIKIVVGSKSPNMLPHCKIRDNPNVSSEEWQYLKLHYCPKSTISGTEQHQTFLELVTSACKRLFNYMDINGEDVFAHRIYDSEIINLTENVSFMLLCPSAELACSIPAKRDLLLQRDDLLSLPLQVFEMIHLNTYRTAITQKFSKLSCLLEIDTITANHLHRKAFSNSEVLIAKERVMKLQELEQRLNAIWKTVRWLMNVICFARDRTAQGTSTRTLLQRSSRMFGAVPQTLQVKPEESLLNKSFGRGSWPGPGNTIAADAHINEFSKSEQNLKTKEFATINPPDDEQSKRPIGESKSDNILTKISVKCNPQRARSNTICNFSFNVALKPKPTEGLAQLGDKEALIPPPPPQNKRKKSKLVSSKSMTNVKQTLSFKFKSGHSNTVHPDVETHLSKSLNNINKVVSELKDECTEEPESKRTVRSSRVLRYPFKNDSGILQVFAAYETGLASGTSLKLHVTPRTTAREVVDLVIKQLNMAVVLKGKEGPVYNLDKLSNFCLVAVIGARERCLRDDFKPLLLQNPWRKGRLYVRQKQDVLAALEHSSRHSTII
ncbi:unnamed protein product [Phyllotreta striolata]|uniref:Ras-associating domain-containing protein n=1 Tax=Phyllotreta striolata TaxID=444603 RepID=A0A9N9U1U8_PHYSR|nr:unnamed protein product [Phyllotreta striolata]